ncbi:MAG: hypothetical protein IT454_19520 [Planctomycetes bacterium]|nr:hypothetical protein [Planctomycetota bacterium]
MFVLLDLRALGALSCLADALRQLFVADHQLARLLATPSCFARLETLAPLTLGG